MTLNLLKNKFMRYYRILSQEKNHSKLITLRGKLFFVVDNLLEFKGTLLFNGMPCNCKDTVSV